MIPVLPAFGGQVPNAFLKIFPNSTYSQLKWGNFNSSYSGSYLLNPLDPLFQKVGSMFIAEQMKEFGTNHVYNCDTFNEMMPANNSEKYLASVGRAIYSGMQVFVATNTN